MADVPKIVLPHGGYRNLIVYKKSDVIYQGTVAFCRRVLPAHGDRTVDQMTQAARSVKTVLTVRVTGTGALTVALDDGTVIGEVTSADGDRELTFDVPSAGCGLNLSYALVDGDTGYAEILGSEAFTGTKLMFR